MSENKPTKEDEIRAAMLFQITGQELAFEVIQEFEIPRNQWLAYNLAMSSGKKAVYYAKRWGLRVEVVEEFLRKWQSEFERIKPELKRLLKIL